MKKVRKMLSVFLAAVMIFSLMIIAPIIANAASHTQTEAVEWIKARANEGWWQDVDGAYGCQCVDLIKAYYQYWGYDTTRGNAWEYKSGHLPSGSDWYYSSTPVPGSVFVKDKDATWTMGHVGLVYAVEGNTIYTVETNVSSPYDGGRPYAKAQYRSHPISYAVTFINPKFCESVPQTPITTSIYTISYEANGGVGDMSQTNVEMNQLVYVNNCSFTRNGYDFDGYNLYRVSDSKWYVQEEGWYTEAEIINNSYSKKVYSGDSYWRFDSSWIKGTNENEIFVFYTLWKPMVYTVSYEANGGIGDMPQSNVEMGQLVYVSDCSYIRNGYEFSGYNLYRESDNKWYVQEDGWYSEADIINNGYSKKLYSGGSHWRFDDSWIQGASQNDSFVFYASWNKTATPITTDPIETQPAKKDISGWTVEGLTDKNYTGKVIKPEFDVVSDDGDYADFDVEYRNNKNVGTATVIITGTGKYTGTITTTFEIVKDKNPIKAKPVSKSVKLKTVKKKNVTVKKAITVNKNEGAVTYSKVSGSKYLSISKKGVITVKKYKKFKKNQTLKIKVKVTAKGNANYKSGSKNVTVKIKVK